MQLSVAQGDGATLRTHLQRLQASTGRIEPRLAAVREPLPPAVSALWDVFGAVSATRAPALEGLGPITCTELEAYGRLHGVAFTPWEAETLLCMDRAARAVPHHPRSTAP